MALVSDWKLRNPRENDAFLRASFLDVLAESKDAPPEQKLIMYDACDEVRSLSLLWPPRAAPQPRSHARSVPRAGRGTLAARAALPPPPRWPAQHQAQEVG